MTCVSLCSLRWMRIVGYNTRFRDAFISLIIGLFINNVLPARIGEVARGYALSKRMNIPFTYAVSTVFIDRVFDLLGLLLITFIFFPGQALPASVSKALYVLVTIFIICVIALFAISQEKIALKITGYFQKHRNAIIEQTGEKNIRDP